MFQSIKESDWKILRELKPVALERLCQRILDELVAVARESKSSHDRYLAVYKLIHDRDEDVADAFNSLSRSQALFKLTMMRRLTLVTDVEFSKFSEETRRVVDSLMGMRDT